MSGLSRVSESPTWSYVLGQLTAGADLDPSDVSWAMGQIMEGSATDAQVAAFGVALKMKGVVGRELEALAATMLSFSRTVHTDSRCVDVVGTGGDRHGTVNISTMSAIVVAACGVPVVKHGNRAATSRSGGADVLEALGVSIDLGPESVTKCIAEAGIGFCFAPVFHPALRFAAAPRKEIGIPTVFNVLGPLTNPAAPVASLIGCAFEDLMPVMAEVFRLRGSSALVVRGHDGLDEVTLTGPTDVLHVEGGQVRTTSIEPEQFGLSRCSLEELRGGDANFNAAIARDLFDGKLGPVRDAVLLNSAAALVAHDALPVGSDLQSAMQEKMQQAQRAIDSAAAQLVLEQWKTVSSSLAS